MLSGENTPIQGLVRRRLASEVPSPTAAPQAMREPDWISGQLRTARGGQRGGYRGGQWRGRGSGAWRGPRNYPY